MFEQDRTLTRLQQRIGREMGLQACFLAGSFGRRGEDPYSDLDVFLVYRSAAAREIAFRQRTELATTIVPYVAVKTWEDPQRPGHIAALYANGSKLDLYFKVAEELTPAPVFRQIAILRDTDGWAEDLSRRSVAAVEPPPPPLGTADLEALDSRFWVSLWDVWRRLARGDVERPFEEYLRLVEEVIPLLRSHLANEDPAALGLVDLVYTRDATTTRAGLRRLAAAYVAARTAIAARYRLAYAPDMAFEKELLELLAR